MTPTDRSLPDGFEDLEPFVEAWAVATTADRVARRNKASYVEKTAFYAVAVRRLTDALAYLDRRDLKTLNPAERRLYELVLAVAHVSLAVERQKEGDEALASSRELLTVRRSVSDI